MLVGADGSGVRILPRQTADDEHPAFLPHAAKIVFEGRRNGAVNLFTVGTDGTNLRQLTTGGGASPAPCANGTIAFVKHANVYLLSANQRSERRLTVSGGREPDCAPNSTRIVFTDRSSNVRTIATTGKQLQVLRRAGPGSVFLSSPVYSPDGSLVAYKSSTEGSDGGGSTDLVVRKLNGSLICQLPGIESQPGSGTYGEGQSSLDASTLTWQPLPGARGHRVLCSSFAAQ
jgi:Tol biopolymer transport system component